MVDISGMSHSTNAALQEFTPPRASLSLAQAHVLILSGSRNHAKTDRTLLTRLGMTRLTPLASGREAARKLAAGEADGVLLDNTLDDMTGVEFLRIIRLHPDLALLPVTMASVDNSRAAVLEALAAGVSGYLIRPYSLEALLRQLTLAFSKARRATAGEGLGLGVAAFEEALAQTPVSQLMHPAQTQAPQEEDPALHDPLVAALRLAEAYAEDDRLEDAAATLEPLLHAVDPAARGAALQLHATLCRQLGRPGDCKDALAAAACAFTQADRPERAAACFHELKRVDHTVVAPDHEVALQSVRNGAFRDAARLYATALNDAPRQEVCAAMSRACMFTDDPVGSARKLAQEVASLRNEDPVLYYEKITGPAPKPRRRAEPKARGLLAEAWAVARVTLKAYRTLSEA